MEIRYGSSRKCVVKDIRLKSIKRLFRFKDGSRNVSEGGSIMIAPNADDPLEEIDLTDAMEQEFRDIKRNIFDDKKIKQVRDRIDKDKKKK